MSEKPNFPSPSEAEVLAAAKAIFLERLGSEDEWRTRMCQLSTARAALLAARLEGMYPSV